MELDKLFKDGLTYPFNDWFKLLIIGLICILSYFILVVPTLLLRNSLTPEIFLILLIISLIFGIYLMGYYVAVIKSTINKENTLPEFNITKNLIDGILATIIEIVYLIIPVILMIILVILSGLGDLIEIANNISMNGGTIPEALVMDFMITLLVLLIISTIMTYIYCLISIIAIARFADKGKFGAAFEIGEILKTIKGIGILNSIFWLIIYSNIALILSIICALIGLIPYIGYYITLLVQGYVILFGARIVGLVYNEA